MNEQDEIRISPDALIAMVVTEAEAREMASMPTLDEMNKDFHPSPDFQHKMEKLLKTAKRKEEKKDVLSFAKKLFVVATTVISVLFSTLLPVQAVREAVVDTLLDWKDEFVAVIFSKDEANIAIPMNIQLDYIPEGFSLVDSISDQQDQYYFLYENSERDQLSIRAITIGSAHKTDLDNEYTTYYTLEFSGHKAIWGVMGDSHNVLEDGTLSYKIESTIGLAEIIKVAENIETTVVEAP